MAVRGLSSHRRKRRQRRIRVTIGFLLLFLLSYTLVSVFLLDVVRVTDDSMAPAIREGDVLLATPLPHLIDGLRPLRRGDIVLLENPSMPDRKLAGHISLRALHLLTLGRVTGEEGVGGALLPRRILALGGERILLDEYRFYLRREGAWVREEQLRPGLYTPVLPDSSGAPTPWPGLEIPGSPDAAALNVAEGRVYLASDHRGGPRDSRVWGPQPVARLHGHLFLRLYPLSRFGPLNDRD
ncbi:MAG: signal peptidase I [Alkalispirochaetaceae bacterium]